MISGGRVFSQIIVPAFHGTYTSKASAVASAVSCGAYTAAGVYKEFLCHNLGADTSLNPHIPVQGIHGNYYQWGRITPVANASTAAGDIAGWNTVDAADGAWTDVSKTTTDPCPVGYRVPTIAQWTYLAANSTVSRSGNWVNDGNYITAVHFGTSTSITLTLPATGYRASNNGALLDRGAKGFYWSSSSAMNSVFADILYFSSSIVQPSYFYRVAAYPVRCVKEDSPASLSAPDAPTSTVGTAGNGLASVSFVAPASNGGSVITGYTVTSSPGSFTATGASSPIVVTGLTNGTSYTFTVVATNAVGNSVASSPSVSVAYSPVSCGAYTAPGVYKEFLCHNLGADTSLDPHTPVQGIHGNYYQWGRISPVANASTAAGAIAGWNTVAAANGAWSDTSKTANDPCPAGYRVPTNEQVIGVIANNIKSRTGSWANDGNFTTALHFGTSSSKTLTFPTAGYRALGDGTLNQRGSNGNYWSSTENFSTGFYFLFSLNSVYTDYRTRTNGLSVRCVKE